MRRLLPYCSDTVDLDEAYAYPEGRVWLRANMVAGIDGAATVDGQSGGLSGEADKRVFSVLRGLADVILVGAATVRKERYGPARPNPDRRQLRAASGQADAPAIAIVSASLDLDPAAAIFTEAVVPTMVITTEAAPGPALEALRKVADVVMAGDLRLDAAAMVDALAARGHRRLLCEGGPHLLAQLAGAGRLDELCLTVSPKLCAGDSPKILAGPALDPPLSFGLAGLLEEQGNLFARYVRS